MFFRSENMITFRLECNAPSGTEALFVAYANKHDVCRGAFGDDEHVLKRTGAKPSLVVRVLGKGDPSRTSGEDAFLDLGYAVFENAQLLNDGAKKNVMYMPVVEDAVWPGTSLTVTVTVKTCSVKHTDDDKSIHPPEKVSDEDARTLVDYIKVSNRWWNDGSGNAFGVVYSNDGTKHIVPTSGVEVSTFAIFDIHPPFYDSVHSGLPGWAFAFPLASHAVSFEWLDSVVHLGASRLGSERVTLDERAGVYMQTVRELRRGVVPPQGTMYLLECLLEGCTAVSTFTTYAEDRSTGESQKACERYSLTPRYGAAGDCEDLAKYIQVALESFAHLTEKDEKACSPAVRAAADLARRYVFGVCIVAASFSSMQDHESDRNRKTDAELDDTYTLFSEDRLRNMHYDDFLSHMVCVAIPRHKLESQHDSNVRPETNDRCPHAPWELVLKSMILEGTGFKSAYADLRVTSEAVRKGLGCLPRPFRALKTDTSNFYGMLISFSCARGVDVVINGETTKYHELVFLNHKNKYGISFETFINDDKKDQWRLVAMIPDGMDAKYVERMVGVAHKKLNERNVLPQRDVSPKPKDWKLFGERMKGLLKEKLGDANEWVTWHEPYEVPKGPADVGYLRSNALTADDRELFDDMKRFATRENPLHCCVEMATPWAGGVRFWIYKNDYR